MSGIDINLFDATLYETIQKLQTMHITITYMQKYANLVSKK